ncbi:MAG: prolyl oligopeptidase family serine peptidase [Oceanicaulis sp.]
MNTITALLAGTSLLAAASPALAQDAPERVTEGNLVMENIPEIPAQVRDRLQQFSNIRSAGFSDFRPEGGIYITTRFGETTQIHAVAEPMGMRRQVTFFDERTGGANVRPDGSGQFVFSKDIGGDEFYQGYLHDPETATSARFTEAGTRNGFFSWSDDGARLAWNRQRDGDPDSDILVGDPSDPGSIRVLHEGEGWMGPGDWSPDGERLLVQRYYSITHSDLFVLDTQTGALTEILPGIDVAYGGAEFAPDGESVYLITDWDSEFRRVLEIELDGFDARAVTPEHGWDVESMDLSPDGSKLVYTINNGGNEELLMIDPQTGAALETPDLPLGLVGGLQFDADGGRLGFTHVSARSPGDAWTYDLASGDLTRWTQSEVGGLDTSQFVEPELITFESFDGLEVPAFYYRAEGDGPKPVIIDIHGGPESQERPGFNTSIQYWVGELGVSVITPNVRGSSGYGKEYVAMDNGFNREDSVRDIGALLDWVAEQPELDSDQVVVYGGSYGGYMVLASMTHYSDRLAGGINIVGISNFVTFLENTNGYRRDLRRAEYGDERDPEMRAHLEAISPANQAEKITAPLFIIQGANDPRVPASEAEQILAAVRAEGGDPWYLLALDEGHGFAKKSNRDFQRQAETMFLNDVLNLD